MKKKIFPEQCAAKRSFPAGDQSSVQRGVSSPQGTRTPGVGSRLLYVCCCVAVMAAQAWAQGTNREQGPHNADITTRPGLVNARQEARKIEAKQEPQVEAASSDRWWKARADKNNDGVIGPSEASSWRTLEKNQLDLNNDGTLSLKEKRLFWRYGYERVRDVRLADYDADKDGVIGPEEAKVYMQERLDAVRSGKAVKVESQLESGYDSNGDGLIDGREAQDLESDLEAY